MGVFFVFYKKMKNGFQFVPPTLGMEIHQTLWKLIKYGKIGFPTFGNQTHHITKSIYLGNP